MKENRQVVLVTGSSSGFGMLTCLRLARKGYHVFASMRDPSKGQELIAKAQEFQQAITIIPLDVTQVNLIQSAVDLIISKAGAIDVLINNAGFGMGGFFEDLSDQDIRQQFEVNYFGVQNVCRAVIPLMRSQKKGKIINISSLAGIQASPCFSAYNASKWALEAFSESLWYELAPFGISVHLVEPGTYKTKIFYENSRFAQNFNNPASPYFARSQFLFKKVMAYVNQCHKDPENIPRLIEKVINQPNAPLRNIPDLEGKTLYFLRKLLPFKLYSLMIKKALYSDYPKD